MNDEELSKDECLLLLEIIAKRIEYGNSVMRTRDLLCLYEKIDKILERKRSI